ncbi:MAG: serine/threonine protein kinase, partial [Deltaproteobacteria bacterium]|nr:serine/threonine protein kinase [Deltaproteobacteria bacterium]
MSGSGLQPTSFYLGRYNCVDRLGGGPATEVFRGKIYGVAGFEKEFAVKRVRAPLLEDAPFIARFIDAAKAASCLDHEGVARVTEVNVQGSQLYLAAELVKGLSFAEVLEAAVKHGPPSPAVACHLLGELLGTLWIAHAGSIGGLTRPLLHLGLSPANAALTFDGRIKLMDFGLFAAYRRGDWTRDDGLRDRLAFLAPEVLKGGPHDGRADVYSAAAVIYALLALRPPFGAPTAEGVTRAALEAKPVPLDAPAPLAHLIARLLDKDPVARPPAAGAASLTAEALRALGRPPERSDVVAYVRRLAGPGGVVPQPRASTFSEEAVTSVDFSKLGAAREEPPARTTRALGSTPVLTPPPLPRDAVRPRPEAPRRQATLLHGVAPPPVPHVPPAPPPPPVPPPVHEITVDVSDVAPDDAVTVAEEALTLEAELPPEDGPATEPHQLGPPPAAAPGGACGTGGGATPC